MLHKKTVERTTFELLKKLQADVVLSTFSLAGGTALALQIGHRISIDLDFFSSQDFDAKKLEKHLIKHYDFMGAALDHNSISGSINGIKVDFLVHDYPIFKPIAIIEDLKLYSINDIAAMKLAAIADNGTRLKDFIDVAYLSQHLCMNDMLLAYKKKFSNSSPIRPLRALCYYEDIFFGEPIMLKSGNYKWEAIELRIKEMIDHPQMIFTTYP